MIPQATEALTGAALAAQDVSWTESLLGLGLPDWFSFVAVAFNGLAGATYAARRGFDVIGVLGLAIAQGLGGLLVMSTLLQLGVPFVLKDPGYVLLALAAGVIGFFFAGPMSQALKLALVMDGLALGFLCAVGVDRAIGTELGPVPAAFIGVVTATGGLILRDVLAGVAPTVLRPGVWVGVAATLGAAVQVVLVEVGVTRSLAQVITVIFVAALRTLSVTMGWRTHAAEDVAQRAARYWNTQT